MDQPIEEPKDQDPRELGKVETPWQRLSRNRAAVLSLFILGFMVIAAIIGPELVPPVNKETSDNQLQPPSAEYWFGTDLNGRGVLYRVLLGARISLTVGIVGAMIAMVIGIGYGMISGYAGGRVDSVMMRIVDVLYAVPRLIVVLILIAVLDPWLRAKIGSIYLPGGDLRWIHDLLPAGMQSPSAAGDLISLSKIMILILALGLIEWLTMARIVRGQVLSIKNKQFVTAAEALGQHHPRIVLKHILPNILGVAITYVTLTIPAVILDESFLSFLGLGVQEPLASWGSLLNDARSVINPLESYWWLLVFPAIAMSLTLLALNFLGDGLRDAFDPKGER
jgi:peptide/nickel transport system permease protein/oligopeptide transport system permease protein